MTGAYFPNPTPKRPAHDGKLLAIPSETMPAYELHIICPACDHEHPHSTTIDFEDGPYERTSVRSAYTGSRLPLNLLLHLVEEVLCPKTERLVRQIDFDKVFLLPTATGESK